MKSLVEYIDLYLVFRKKYVFIDACCKAKLFLLRKSRTKLCKQLAVAI